MAEAFLSVTEAAKACGLSRGTIYRHMEKLEGYGAIHEGKGYRIPFSALVATGLAPRVSPPEHPEQEKEPSPRGSEIERLEKELAEAKEKIAQLTFAKALAETLASERERVIEAQERALLLLESKAKPALQGLTEQISEPREEKKPGLFSRLFGGR